MWETIWEHWVLKAFCLLFWCTPMVRTAWTPRPLPLPLRHPLPHFNPPLAIGMTPSPSPIPAAHIAQEPRTAPHPPPSRSAAMTVYFFRHWD